MSLPFRTRLTLQWTTSFALLLAGANLAIYLGTRSYLLGARDAETRTLAGTEAASVVDDDRGAHVHEFDPESVGLGQTGKFAQVMDAEGQVLLSSTALAGQGPLLSPADLALVLQGRAPIVDVRIDGRPGRAVGVRRIEAGRTYVVVAGLWSDGLQRGLRHLAWLLVGVWAAGVGLTAGLGLALASRVLRPVERITLRAAAIAAGDLRARLGPAEAQDEIGRMSERLDAMLARLQGALEANRRFAASASHELRTPLAAIQGEVEVALRRERGPAAYRQALETVGTHAREMTALTADLLSLVRALEGRPELELREVPLDAVVERSRQNLAPVLAQRQVRFETSGLAGLLAYGDGRLLARLLDNVLTNGARHCREGGCLTVDGVAEPGPPGWHAGRVRLRISNDGPEIPARDWERIFEPFEQLAPDSSGRPGYGLGLAIAREVARLHGGDVEVLESSPLRTTFVITLRGVLMPAADWVDPAPEAVRAS
ncbi:MAG TPA: ATP-binding protein [Vicinamibacteria bacterium]